VDELHEISSPLPSDWRTTMSSCCWLVAGIAYIGFILAAGRVLSHKWHPDGGDE
jgi:hypothetical protein